MDREEGEIRQLIQMVIGRLAPEPVQIASSPEKLREDLTYDSLALVELSFVLEELFSLDPISNQAAAEILTVCDAEDYIVALVRQRGWWFESDDPDRARRLLSDPALWTPSWRSGGAADPGGERPPTSGTAIEGDG